MPTPEELTIPDKLDSINIAKQAIRQAIVLTRKECECSISTESRPEAHVGQLKENEFAVN